ncbi:MAG: transcription antitermination factor NusB [Dorea sp.]|nr:transcription antitermination factor NusB [Dorea sp.]
MKRSESREHIFKILFGVEFAEGEELSSQIALYAEEELEGAKEAEIAYIRDKAMKVAEKLPEIDEILAANSKGWKTTRMNKVDLSIMRLAVYEMKWDEDVPSGVAINEAVELAKKYSSDQGPAFVNAVLGKITKLQ